MSIKEPELGEIEVDDVIQGSAEWRQAKLGIPSASNFARVMAGGRGGEPSVTRADYLDDLAGEAISGEAAEDFKSAAMERGNVMEPEMRSQYAFLYDVAPQPAGFFRRRFGKWWIGASPDSLVGEDEVVEYKSMIPRLLLRLMENPRVPPEHMPQCQGTLLVTGRQVCNLTIGYRGMRPVRFRVRRDPSYQARLLVGLHTFLEELDQRVEWARKWRQE